MGSCVSIHKGTEADMKVRLSVGSKNENVLIPSPVKQKPDKGNSGDPTVADLALKSSYSPPRFRDSGSKEEAFFDSQPWLESDCEDDFLSVNGDFTPSVGNTPVHKFSSRTPPVKKAPVELGQLGSITGSSPSDKRKRLSELFKENLSSHQYIDYENAAKNANVVSEKVKHKTNETPRLSGSSNERTPDGFLKAEEKTVKSAQCCLPKLLSSRSFSERKKKTSPVQSTG